VAYGVHLELGGGRVLVVPAGIGVRPPLVRDGGRLRGGQCELRLRTLEPTGLIAVAAGSGTPTLGALFARDNGPGSTYNGGPNDAFVAKLNPFGTGLTTPASLAGRGTTRPREQTQGRLLGAHRLQGAEARPLPGDADRH